MSTDKIYANRIYWWGFFVRVFIGLLAWYLHQYTSLSLVEDASLYERLGAAISSEWLAHGSSSTLAMLQSEGYQAWGMPFVIACIYFMCGGLRVISFIIVVLSFLTAFMPVMTYRIARVLGMSPKASFYTAKWIIFSPVFAFWSGALYKEGVVLLVLNVIVYEVLILQQRIKMRSLFVLCLAIMTMLALRFYLVLLLVPSIAIGLTLAGKRNITKRGGKRVFSFIRQVIIVGVLGGILMGLGLSTHFQNMLPGDLSSTFETLQNSRSDLAESGQSGYLKGADVSSPQNAIRFLPKGLVYFWTVPFPWDLGSFRQNLVLPEMAIWLWMYPFIFMGMKIGLKKNFQGSILLIILTLSMSFLYAIVIGNAGTAYRMRAQVWLFWVLFLGWYKEKKLFKRNQDQIESKKSLIS